MKGQNLLVDDEVVFFPSNKPPSPVDNQPKKGLLRRVSSVFSSKMAFKQTDSESTASISVSTHTDTSPISENNNSQNFSLSTPNNNEPPQQRLSDLWDRLDVQAVEEQIETIDKRTIGNSNSYNDINETIPIEINDSALPVGNKADATAPQENNSLSLMGIGSFFTETINPLTYISLYHRLYLHQQHLQEKRITATLFHLKQKSGGLTTLERKMIRKLK